MTPECWILLGVSAWEKETYSDWGLHWGRRQRPISLDCAGRIWTVTALRPPTRATEVLSHPGASCCPSVPTAASHDPWVRWLPLARAFAPARLWVVLFTPTAFFSHSVWELVMFVWSAWQFYRKSMWLHFDLLCLLVARIVSLIWRNSDLVFSFFSHLQGYTFLWLEVYLFKQWDDAFHLVKHHLFSTYTVYCNVRDWPFKTQLLLPKTSLPVRG